MRRANVYVNGTPAGVLEENGREEPTQSKKDVRYVFRYDPDYRGDPISLTMPVQQKEYSFEYSPPFFDGVLPEGLQLESLLRQKKIDRTDYFSQLVAVGGDLVGAVTVVEEMI